MLGLLKSCCQILVRCVGASLHEGEKREELLKRLEDATEQERSKENHGDTEHAAGVDGRRVGARGLAVVVHHRLDLCACHVVVVVVLGIEELKEMLFSNVLHERVF